MYKPKQQQQQQQKSSSLLDVRAGRPTLRDRLQAQSVTSMAVLVEEESNSPQHQHHVDHVQRPASVAAHKNRIIVSNVDQRARY